MYKRFAILFLGILILGFVFAAETFKPITAVDQRTFESQPDVGTPLPDPPTKIIVELEKSNQVVSIADFGKTVEKGWIDKLHMSLNPKNDYVSFIYKNQKMVDIILVVHNKGGAFGTGVFYFMVVDYTKNPDGTERLVKDETPDNIKNYPPRVLFFRADEEEKLSVSIPGVGKINEFSADETFSPISNAEIENFKVTLDDSFYNSLPALIDKRTNGVQQQAQDACSSIARCLAYSDKQLAQGIVK